MVQQRSTKANEIPYYHVVSRIPSSSSSADFWPFPMVIIISRITARRSASTLSSGPLSFATVMKVTWPN